MAKAPARGGFACFFLYLVLCSIASNLPGGLAVRHLAAESGEQSTHNVNGSAKQLGLKQPHKGPVNPPSGPSPGTHPEEPPLPSSPPEITFPGFPPKRPRFPPSGPSPGTHPEEPPLPQRSTHKPLPLPPPLDLKTWTQSSKGSVNRYPPSSGVSSGKA